jgi:hypothetical protein
VIRKHQLRLALGNAALKHLTAPLRQAQVPLCVTSLAARNANVPELRIVSGPQPNVAPAQIHRLTDSQSRVEDQENDVPEWLRRCLQIDRFIFPRENEISSALSRQPLDQR